MEYRGVHMPSGQQVFHFGPIQGTNNIGEFLAIVHAMALMEQKGIGMPIYSDSRNAMMRAMVTYLLENGKIETTVPRAKDVRSMAEKMITLGKSSDLHTKRQVYSYITKEDVAKKLFDEIGPKYADRNGGYTRIVRIGPRRGDAAEMAIIQLV